MKVLPSSALFVAGLALLVGCSRTELTRDQATKLLSAKYRFNETPNDPPQLIMLEGLPGLTCADLRRRTDSLALLNQTTVLMERAKLAGLKDGTPNGHTACTAELSTEATKGLVTRRETSSDFRSGIRVPVSSRYLQVTGIRQKPTEPTDAIVEFTEGTVPNRFGKALWSYADTARYVALLSKYDDGWRVISISSHE